MYSHPNEVWALESSPNDSSLVITSGNGMHNPNNDLKSSVNLYKMPNQVEEIITEGREGRDAFAGNKLQLEHQSSLELWDNSSFVHSIRWNKEDSVITCDSNYVCLYSSRDSETKVK